MDKAIDNYFHTNPYKYKDSVLTCILCGTFSACGGGLLADWLGFFRTPTFTINSTPSIFSLSNKRALSTLSRSFCLAIIYYVLMNPSGYLPWNTMVISKESGHLLICLLQLFHLLLITISSDLDIYGYLAELIGIEIKPKDYTHSSTNIHLNSTSMKSSITSKIANTNKVPHEEDNKIEKTNKKKLKKKNN